MSTPDTSNYEEFSAENSDAYWFDNAERHSAAMHEVIDTIILESDQGQEFSGLHLNRDFAGNGEPVIVALGQFLGASNGPYRKYEAYQYAAAFPENQVVLIDLPAHGYSSPSTSEQRREVLLHRGLSNLAEAQAEGVSNLLDNEATPVYIIGDSFGGRIMPDLAIAADDTGIDPIAMIGHEIAGIDQRSSLSIAKGFYLDELKLKKMYRDNQGAQHLRDAFEVRFKGELEKYGYDESRFNLYGIYLKDPVFPLLVLARSPLASDRGFDVLEKALDTHPELTANIVSGGLSKVARLRKIRSRATELVNQYPDQLQWDLWPQDSHNMGLTDQQPRLVKYAVAAIASRASTT